MTDTTEPTPDTQTSDSAAKGPPKLLRSLGVFGVIALVIGALAYLSSLDHPPDLPGDGTHQFRFNVDGDLVGMAIEAGAGAPEVAHTSGLKRDKKGIEATVNTRCQSCHGAPGLNLQDHACRQINKCVPELHPPKTTCIKCHRHVGD